MTVRKLYEEYHAGHPDGYLRASFGMKLRQFMLQTNAIGHVEHRAGDQMYIDFAGDRLDTAEVRKVEVFVAILPCCHYTYCEAVWSQKKEDLIKACENAFHFYGGAPCAIVPDNLKSAVTRSDRNEPVINADFESFAEHYGCAVVPARVRHPKDKALVENAVKLMYRSVYVDLEGLVFHNLESLNEAILKSLETFNARNLTRRRESRRQLFEAVEKDALRPLPASRYQMKQRAVATVQRNSYVTLNKHYYSVPVQYVGKRVDLVYDTDTIDIFQGFTRRMVINLCNENKSSTFAESKTAMEKNPYIELAECLLPEEMVEYFEVVKVEKTSETLDVTLEERDNGVEGYKSGELRPNGFYEESIVRDYPVRGRKMSFHIKRRRWVEIETGKSVSRRWDLVAEGTRFSKEFAAFLKDMLGQIPDYGPLS